MTAFDSATLYDAAETYGGPTVGTKPTFQVLLGTTLAGTTTTDIAASVRRITITRGRGPLAFGTFDPGRCTLELFDTDSSFFPANTGGEQPNLNSPVSVTATFGGETYYLFYGYLDEVLTQWVRGAAVAYSTMTFTDGMKLLAKSHTTWDGADEDRPATRINAMLDVVDFGDVPGAALLYDSATVYDSASYYGGRTSFVDTLTDVLLPPDTTDRRPVLDAIRRVETAEAGALYFDARGRCIFLGRGQAWPVGNPVVTFTDDSTDTASAPYTGIRAVTDEQLLYNRVTVTRDSGTEQLAESASSQATYFLRDLNMTGVLLIDDTDAAILAAHHLSKRSLPLDRVESLDVAAYTDARTLYAALNLDLLDVISVRRAAPSWTATTNLVVSGVRHDITPADWRVTYSTQARV